MCSCLIRCESQLGTRVRPSVCRSVTVSFSRSDGQQLTIYLHCYLQIVSPDVAEIRDAQNKTNRV